MNGYEALKKYREKSGLSVRVFAEKIISKRLSFSETKEATKAYVVIAHITNKRTTATILNQALF